jgi:hypothetical protein
MVCSKTEDVLVVRDRDGHALKQVETFKYLGSMLNAKGGCEVDVRNRKKAAWQKWRDLTGVLCDQKISVQLRGKVYRTMIRPVLIYGAEAWALRRREEEQLERTEMKMLRWILGVSLRDRKRNEDIRKTLGVTCITNKVREARLRWYGHVERASEDDSIKRVMRVDVKGRRSRGRQKKRWMDAIKQDFELLNLKREDTSNRVLWRRLIRVADPSPARD